jgi:hypothetical protein
MIEIFVRNRNLPDYDIRKPAVWVKVKRAGKKYDLGGDGIVELFTLKVLAEAIDRTTDVVKDWEKKGLVPKSYIKVDGTQKGVRFYHPSQVINFNNLMRVKYKGWKYMKDTKLFKQWCADLTKLWYRRDILTPEQLTGVL